MSDVSVVIPVYNEEKAIEGVINEVKQAMNAEDYSYEILIVDDASSDDTVNVSKKNKVKVICHPVNLGSGAARRTGIEHSQGRIIVMLDGDGSYSGKDIGKLLKYFPQYDQVNGARHAEKGSFKLLRVPAKWFIKKIACYLTGIDIPDLNTGLKAFKKDVMKKYLWVIPDGFSCVTTMTLAFLCNGHPTKWVPTEYRRRLGKSKFHPVKDTFNYLLTVFRILTYFKPLKVFLPLGFSFLALGFISALRNIFFTHGIQQMDIIIIIFGFMIGMLGLLADLIVAVHKKP